MNSVKIFFGSLMFFAASTFAYPNHLDLFNIFDYTVEIITKNFYDQTFHGLNWSVEVQKTRKKLEVNPTNENLKIVINQLLKKLNSSHTEFLSSSDQDYWGVKSIFSHQIDGNPVKQIGAWFSRINNRWFIRNVFEESPAALAGLLPGDEILSVNGKPFSPIDSFKNSDEDTFLLEIRQTRISKPKTFVVKAVKESFQRTMLRGSIASYKIYKVYNKKIGYFHLWSGTHEKFKNVLANIAKKASLETDAFLLDLRDGFGGADPSFLDPFFNHVYSKPMVVLINDGVRSGKEWISYILQKNRRAIMLGTKTKGYVMGGSLFEIIPEQFDLYLAVDKGPIPELEGNGISPDIEVYFNLAYSAGSDPQLEKGLQVLGNT